MKNVEYDLNNSKYNLRVENYEFFFSSAFNLTRFHNGYDKYVKEENIKIKIKFHVNIDLTSYLLVSFYKKIEKRGFKVLTYKNNDIIELQEDYIFKIGE